MQTGHGFTTATPLRAEQLPNFFVTKQLTCSGGALIDLLV